MIENPFLRHNNFEPSTPSGTRRYGTEESMLEIVDARIEVEGIRVEPLAPIPEG